MIALSVANFRVVLSISIMFHSCPPYSVLVVEGYIVWMVAYYRGYTDSLVEVVQYKHSIGLNIY